MLLPFTRTGSICCTSELILLPHALLLICLTKLFQKGQRELPCAIMKQLKPFPGPRSHPLRMVPSRAGSKFKDTTWKYTGPFLSLPSVSKTSSGWKLRRCCYRAGMEARCPRHSLVNTLTTTISFECILLPCFLYFINPKHLSKTLGSQTHPFRSSESAAEHSRQWAFFDTLKSFQSQSSCHEHTRELLEHIAHMLPVRNSHTASSGCSDVPFPREAGPIVDWIRMLVTQPGRYLRVVRALDQFLNIGQVHDHGRHEHSFSNAPAEQLPVDRPISKIEPRPTTTQAITPPPSYYSPYPDTRAVLTDHGDGAEATHGILSTVNNELLQSLFSDPDAVIDWQSEGELDFNVQVVSDLSFEEHCT